GTGHDRGLWNGKRRNTFHAESGASRAAGQRIAHAGGCEIKKRWTGKELRSRIEQRFRRGSVGALRFAVPPREPRPPSGAGGETPSTARWSPRCLRFLPAPT